jgi:hypothetical protein
LKAVDPVAFFFPAVGSAFGVWLAANESRKKILSRQSRPIEFLFGADRAHQTKLSYFFGCIDFAPCDGDIDRLAIIDRVAPRNA